jgi:solute carrier family 25 S-adenosylmethionine transporter 26
VAAVKTGRVRRKKNLYVYDVNIPLPATLLKSPPTSAAFFSVYNKTKPYLESHGYFENINQSMCHILAVYMGHTASCIIRVPVDVTRAQARVDTNMKMFTLVNKLLCSPGIYRRLAKQLTSTVARELPFCSIKFPLWEFLKINVEKFKDGKEIGTWESALCGSIAGGTAAALTMPIDLAYKRINVEKVSQELILSFFSIHLIKFKSSSLST